MKINPALPGIAVPKSQMPCQPCSDATGFDTIPHPDYSTARGKACRIYLGKTALEVKMKWAPFHVSLNVTQSAT